MRPIDFCKPHDFRAPSELFDSPFYGRRTRLTPHRSLRSSPLFHRDLPCPFEQNGSRALRRPLRFPGLRPESGEMFRGSLWIICLVSPSAEPPCAPAAFSAAIRVRRRCLWHHRHIAVRRRTSTSRTACVRRLVKSVGPFGPWCLRSNRVRCFLRPLYAAVFRGARHSVPPPLRGGAGASLSIRRSC
jgi:hypothetical protein